MLACVRLSARIIVTAMALLLSLCIVFIAHSMHQARAEANSVTTVSCVNAASYLGPLAPGAIAAAFGTNLAVRTESAQSLPLPTQLAGTTVSLVDSSNITHQAQLFFVSTGQINYLIPEKAMTGNTQIIVTNANGEVSTGTMQIENISPAIFTATASGQGVVAALTTFDNVQFDATATPNGTARPVSSGTASRPNYLILFGTGLRRAVNARVRIGGIEVTPMYVGAQGGFSGLDQINLIIPSNAAPGMNIISITADGRTSNIGQLMMQQQQSTGFLPLTLNATDVQTIIAQAVGKAQQVGLNVTVAVTDREGNVLGVFRMNGAPQMTTVGLFDLVTRAQLKPTDPDGLQNTPVLSSLAAISKAGTAAFFSTGGLGFGGSAISTRTASFIIQDHFPPRSTNQMGGPLFGVQFSQLPCSDVKTPRLPLGLSGDPGGYPLYKNGVMVGGVGIEGDGLYSVDVEPRDFDMPLEEIIAVAAGRGYDVPQALRIDNATIDGKTLAFSNSPQTGNVTPPFASLPGTVDPQFPIRDTPASQFTPLTLGGIPGRVVMGRFFPFKDSASTAAVKLTASDVNTIITQAAQGAFRVRAAIRFPIGTPAQVNITVVDTSGAVLGIFSTIDAPIFGFDVSAQKARSANFFSSATAGAQLRAAGLGKFVDAAAADGVMLDGSFAFSDRGVGSLSRPTFPDGIDGTVNGAFSKPINVWSPFNDGLQLVAVLPTLQAILAASLNPSTNLSAVLSADPPPVTPCTAIPALGNGAQIFAGSVPLFKNGVLVGAVGISGDGIDQDDIIATQGSFGFETPLNVRCDQIVVRNVRLPFVQFPSHPFIP